MMSSKDDKMVRMTLEEAKARRHVIYPGQKTVDELMAMKDEDIDYSDIPELTEDFWKNARLLTPAHKKMISMRIDEDVLEWFKSQGAGYQSSINAVLKAYVEAHKHS